RGRGGGARRLRRGRPPAHRPHRGPPRAGSAGPPRPHHRHDAQRGRRGLRPRARPPPAGHGRRPHQLRPRRSRRLGGHAPPPPPRGPGAGAAVPRAHGPRRAQAPHGGLAADFKKGLVLLPGDDLVLTREAAPGGPAEVDTDGTLRTTAHVACTHPEVFRAVRPGQPVWFDDGKIGGVVRSTSPEALVVRITHAKPDGSRPKGSRGIHLPETALALPALTEKDRADLAFAAPRADLVGLSFVNGPEDVAALQEALAGLGVPQRGIVLKIETRRGFEQLPRILLRAL